MLARPAAVLAAARLALAVPIGYLSALTAAAWVATAGRSVRRGGDPGPATTRFAVLVPAHDEEAVIADTLRAMTAIDYPGDRFRVHVVADHCTDRTVELARAGGAEVHEHVGPQRGKGPALQWVVGRVLAADPSAAAPVDAVVIVDADTVVDPGLLRALDRVIAGGARAVQAHYGVRDPGSSAGAGLRAAALALRHHLRPLGRTALGASCGLYGNGMAFTADVLARREWTDHLTEDIEFQMELLLDGTLVAYAPDARIEAEMPATLEAARTQNERWERGRIELARRYVPRLLRVAADPTAPRRVAALDGALDHVVPPLSVLVAATGGVAVASSVVSRLRRRGGSRGGAALCVALVVHVVSGLVLDRAPWSVWRALLRAPAMVVWKLRLWGRMLLRPGREGWVRTAREGAG